MLLCLDLLLASFLRTLKWLPSHLASLQGEELYLGIFNSVFLWWDVGKGGRFRFKSVPPKPISLQLVALCPPLVEELESAGVRLFIALHYCKKEGSERLHFRPPEG